MKWFNKKNTLINGVIALNVMLLMTSKVAMAADSGTSFNVTSKGPIVTITSTPASQPYAHAGLKITTAGYSVTNPGVDCQSNANGYCLFSVSDTTPKNIAITGASGPLNMTLCLDGVNALSCQNYPVSITSAPRVAYVTNEDVNEVLVCPIKATGALGACVIAGSDFNSPSSVVINKAATFAYVTNFGNSSVSTCPINADKTFGACVQTKPYSFGLPTSITLNSASTAAYVANFGKRAVSFCSINHDGSLGACVDSNVDKTFSYASGITLNRANTFAYVGNGGNSTVSVCALNVDGTLSSCSDSGNTGVKFQGPANISLNATETLAYVANANPNVNSVVICPILANGLFGACVDSANKGIPFDVPTGLAFNSAASLLYVVNSDNSTIAQCPVNVDGTLAACVDAGNTGILLNGPAGIALN